MTFLNPFYLIGLAAAALPVLFHLFARKRARRIEFSSLRFLQKLEKTSMRAVKVRQILLLIVRTLLVVVIVLAFARPALRGYLGSFLGASHANTSLVFLIDNSASMSRSDEHGELLKQSKEAAVAVASLLEQGDEAIVIPLASMQRGKEFNPIHTRQEVLSAINEIREADRPALLADGLRVASAALSKSLNVNKEVYLFSDGQARNLKDDNQQDTTRRTASDTVRASKLFDAGTRIYTMTVGNGERVSGRNLSLDSLKPVTTVFEPGRPIEFEAFVRNTTDQAAQNVVLSLFYNDERVAQKTIANVGASAGERVALEGPVRGSGIISVRAELENDALPFDNRRFTVLTVPASRRIGIFMQDPSGATFLSLALSQTLSDAQAGIPFTTETKRLEDLRSLLAIGARYDAIAVGLGPSVLSDADLAGLKEYISSGHGASIFLMPGLDWKATSAHDLVPLGLPTITNKEGNPNEQSRYLSFAQFDFAHPFFAGMFEAVSTSGNALRGIESPKIYEAYDLASNRGLPLVKLSNGSPFLVESKLGKGDVLLFALPPTMHFSDFPRKGVFLPIMRRAAAYSSAVRSQRDENVAPQFVTTEPFEVDLPQLAGEQPGATVLVKAPDGTSERAQIALSSEGKPRIHLEEARVAGNYTVFRDAEAREPVAAFAVNIQSDESDLRTADKRTTDAFLQARSSNKNAITTLDPNNRTLAQTIQQSRYGVELWQSFLYAALILALIEMAIAREAKRDVALAG